MQANDLIADLRAEVSAWWEGKMADHRSSVIAAAAAALVTNHVSLFVFLFDFSIIRNMYSIVDCCNHTFLNMIHLTETKTNLTGQNEKVHNFISLLSR
jgi:hypothetical protein